MNASLALREDDVFCEGLVRSGLATDEKKGARKRPFHSV